ncbi:MAG: dihydroorotase [Cyanobacteriota bacterium]
MAPRYLRQVQVLRGPDQRLRHEDALLDGPLLLAVGPEAGARAAALGLDAEPTPSLLLAPALVDPHSTLDHPLQGPAETATSLRAAAACGGYGTVALLPRSERWRDQPELLQPLLADGTGPELKLWGSFSRRGLGEALAPHAAQLAAGAIGLADDDYLPPLALLERGLRLAEMGTRPVLVAPRDPALCQQGFVREGVEALRAGWPPDPVLSETLPLQSLLALSDALPLAPVQLMNLSPASAVELLGRRQRRLPASVCWWHLVSDSANLDPQEEGWRLVPSLGTAADREALINGLATGVLSAVAVHHIALDPEEQLLPIDQRRAGLAGFPLVLPLLWRELVQQRGWSPEALWQVLCWGPAAFLGLVPPRLEPGSRQWLLYDPARPWTVPGPGRRAPGTAAGIGTLAANLPCQGQEITGQVVACGLRPGPDSTVLDT